MKNLIRTSLLVVLVGLVVISSGLSRREAPSPRPLKGWLLLEPGLELGSFAAPQKSRVGDSRIRVLRIDPSRFEFVLLNAKASSSGERLSARDWVVRHGLVAAVNASMYQADMKTSISLMKTGSQINNPRVSNDQTILAFHPRQPGLPRVQIIDRECQDWEQLREKYNTLIQNIRMISCHEENVWAPQDKIWSTAAIGMDGKNRILFIHARSPYSTHDLIDNLLELPLGLKRAMYVEGGPQAQLYINNGRNEFEFLGSYSSGSNENDDNDFAWPIPNVVGIQRAASSRG